MGMDGLPVRNQLLPSVSCDRCGRPRPKVSLKQQDGFWRCELCIKMHGESDLMRIDAKVPDPEPLKVIFGGRGSQESPGSRYVG